MSIFKLSQKDRKDFVSVVRKGFEKKYFRITDTDNYGCMGLHCETPSNGFYCLPIDAETWEGTPEEYVKYLGIENVYTSVADTVLDMLQEEIWERDLGEGYLYVLELADVDPAPVIERLLTVAKNS